MDNISKVIQHENFRFLAFIDNISAQVAVTLEKTDSLENICSEFAEALDIEKVSNISKTHMLYSDLIITKSTDSATALFSYVTSTVAIIYELAKRVNPSKKDFYEDVVRTSIEDIYEVADIILEKVVSDFKELHENLLSFEEDKCENKEELLAEQLKKNLRNAFKMQIMKALPPREQVVQSLA